jgi:predicted AAA+ superfamily ATPase
LALQIGSEISATELSKNLWVDVKTVIRYIDLLMKSYIIFKLPPLFKNKRKEISKQNKVYFYDLWIRNIIINNLNSLDNRTDIWWLWENFLILERIKKNTYEEKLLNTYFWRNYNKQEIDYIEEHWWKVFAYEFKWWKKKVKIPKPFLDFCQNTDLKLINKENYFEFIV